MKQGDTVVLKEDYNVSISLGNIGFSIAGGTKGIILETGEVTLGEKSYTSSISVGFKITDTITVRILIDKDAIDELE